MSHVVFFSQPSPFACFVAVWHKVEHAMSDKGEEDHSDIDSSGRASHEELMVWAQVAPTELDMELLEAEYDLLHSEEQGHERPMGSSEMRLPIIFQPSSNVLLPVATLAELRPPVAADAIDTETVIETIDGNASDRIEQHLSSDEEYMLRHGPTLNPAVNRMMAALAPPGEASSSTHIVPVQAPPPVDQKRRRLREKTTVLQIGPAPLNFVVARKSILMAKLKKHTGFDRMRDYYEARRLEALRQQFPDKAAVERREIIRTEWQGMTDGDKQSWVHRELASQYQCLSVTGSADYWNHQQAQAEMEESKAFKFIRDGVLEPTKADWSHVTCGCMATWNGSWLCKDPEWTALVNQNMDPNMFIKFAPRVPAFKDLCLELETFVKRRITLLGFDKYSIQIEASLHARARGRIHIHAYWHHDVNNCYNGTALGWMFRGAAPLLKLGVGKGRNKESMRNRGHYYCQAPKEGRLFCATNYIMNLHFIVEPKWIMALWTLRKLSHTNAKSEILQARGRVAHSLKEISTVETMEEALEIEAEKKQVHESLKSHMRPFWEIPLVAEWADQYKRDVPNAMYGVKARFKFLVLNGPSCYGKTQFAKSIFGVDNSLLVPCENISSPCLKDFRRGVHKCIVFDECSSSIVVQNKMLFQANSDGVLLGQSQCNEYAYWKYLYCTPMIVCCNDWMKGIEASSPDGNWLFTNSMFLEITHPLWAA